MYYSYQYDFCFLSAEFLGSAAPPIGPGLPVGRRGAAAAAKTPKTPKTPKTQLNKTNNNNNNNSINNLEARDFIYGPWTFKNRIGFQLISLILGI